jgi:hypothetical protein
MRRDDRTTMDDDIAAGIGTGTLPGSLQRKKEARMRI